MEQLHGYDLKVDIWSFDITVTELAHGHAPFSRYPPIKVLLMTLQSGPPCVTNLSDDMFSNSFRQMVVSCLIKDHSRLLSAKILLKHSFFGRLASLLPLYVTRDSDAVSGFLIPFSSSDGNGDQSLVLGALLSAVDNLLIIVDL
ncbi:uncharacterized protein LOC133035769 [Cannabis sativa]|uniref:uncharacterized protein LOC133035769 n=1 Tax=Cannabis sativa TaxID=3483 RepID=UPI0029CAA5C5|nr:uncharacterized protein LOC133035769 [Cannabis sativa]